MISAQTRSAYARENRFALCANAALRVRIMLKPANLSAIFEPQALNCSDGLAEDGLWLESTTIHMLVRRDLPLRMVELKFIESVSFDAASGPGR
jgi:hypothetical protein